MTTTFTSTAASPIPTFDDSDDESSGPTSSPLLFFVALGFGVVFTNLWIIVGVKYCFRYNRRNRQRAQNESGDPIDLSVMQRPHRRRREKKLMSMDEVNERFPLTKYKMWRSSREHEGLPAAGGIAQPGLGSRPASIKEELNDPTNPSESTADASQSLPVSSSPPADKPDEQTRPATADTPTHGQDSTKSDKADDTNMTAADAAAGAAASEKPTDNPQEGKAVNGANPESQSRPDDHHETDDDEDDEDDPARAPIQQELLDSPGDTCAICLDNLDDDDDVRGLTCGHAFHAGCLDPWLTGRRACCPLCKADYYVPKVRPETAGANVDEAQMSPLASNGSRIGIPVTPHGAMIGRVGGGLPFLTFRPRTNNAANNTPTSPSTPVMQQGVAIDDNAEASQQRRGLGQSLFGFAGRIRRNRNLHAQSSPSTSTPQFARTNSQSLSTPATPRSPLANNVSTTTTTTQTPMSANPPMNALSSSPPSTLSPSPNWRTRLLPARRSRPSTDATPPLSSFASRLRRGRRDGNNNNANDHDDFNDGIDSNSNEVGGTRISTSNNTSTNTTPPVLPAPAFGGDVGMAGMMGSGTTPSQLEAGVVRA